MRLERLTLPELVEVGQEIAQVGVIAYLGQVLGFDLSLLDLRISLLLVSVGLLLRISLLGLLAGCDVRPASARLDQESRCGLPTNGRRLDLSLQGRNL